MGTSSHQDDKDNQDYLESTDHHLVDSTGYQNQQHGVGEILKGERQLYGVSGDDDDNYVDSDCDDDDEDDDNDYDDDEVNDDDNDGDDDDVDDDDDDVDVYVNGDKDDDETSPLESGLFQPRKPYKLPRDHLLARI